MSPPTTRYVTTSDGVSVAYIRVGNGPPIIFPSNFGGDVHNYHVVGSEQRGLTDRLAGLGWQVIRHDGRGFGASPRDVSDRSLAARVRDLDAVVRLVASPSFALIGVDQGAPTAIAYAASHPARVSHLVLICPWVSGAARYDLPAPRIALAGAPTTEAAWNLLTKVIANVATDFADPDRGRRFAESIREGTSAPILNAYAAASRAIDVGELLPRITVPTLVIHEPAFPFGSFELCRDVASGIPDARLAVVHDRSIMGVSHDETVPLITRFLRAESASDRPPAPTGSGVSLTPREREVLRLIAAGCSNKDIARALTMSERTAARHITNIYAKIGTHSKAAATAYAIRHGLS
jgi:pimeloyl-ACP methyl ester carboxylesterase/DNA-binding CsgD family transcriptional regulator